MNERLRSREAKRHAVEDRAVFVPGLDGILPRASGIVIRTKSGAVSISAPCSVDTLDTSC